MRGRRTSKYLATLFTALEQGGQMEILFPSNKAARHAREGLYKARAKLKSRSVDDSTPFDRFVIGVSDTKLIIDTDPPSPLLSIEELDLQPTTQRPTHGGKRS